jgi:AcrR family transcriptional regulator
MGRPAKFSRERLQATALALVDRDGLGGLTMRALAAELGTGPMTLYNHVAHREELEMLVVEAVLAEARWSHTVHADWRDDVRSVAIAGWRAVRAHPHAIPLILTRRSRSPAVFELGESLLAALARSGRSGRSLLDAFRALTAFIMGSAQAELAGPLTAQAGETPQGMIRRFRALPRHRYPRLIEIAGAASRSNAERELRAGLEILLAGLENRADSPRRRRARSASSHRHRN